MLQIPGYSILNKLAESSHGCVLEGTRRSDGLAVVFKTYREHGEPRAQSRAAHEFSILQRVAGPGIGRPVALEDADGADVLVLEAFDGISLSDYLERVGPLDVETFLKIALLITQGLARVHQMNIVHKDVKLRNVLIREDPLETCLIDFGISAELGGARRAEEPRGLEGTRRTMAPEQTGRIGKGIDCRTDLYSLGASLYELLTGQPPFADEDVVDVVHAHLAARPKPVSVIRSDVPPLVSELVLRLLEKDPEARYQSAYGLAADLEALLEQWQVHGQIDAQMKLGAFDHSDRLNFPAELFGREREQQELVAAFERVACGGTELLLVSGPSGVGKSALPGLLRERTHSAQGFMGSGKCDLDGMQSPYAGIASALTSITDQILAESHEGFILWRGRLRDVLGNIGAALLPLAPELAVIVEDFPSVPVLSAGAAKSRLALALDRFVHALTQSGRPVVLVLDDLQWADAGSVYLLEALLCSGNTRHLLIVGTLRGERRAAPYLVRQALARIQEVVPISEIRLGPLSSADTTALLERMLDQEAEAVRPLAELIARKTSNTPLEVRELLSCLCDQGLLNYQHGSGWSWDTEALDALDVTSDAADFLVRTLQSLSEATRTLLTTASLIGDRFELDTVWSIVGGDRLQHLQALTQLIDQGLLTAGREGFQFAHDRIREACLSLLPEAERSRLHFALGLSLLARCDEDAEHSAVFDAVTQLNRGRAQLPPDRRIEVVRLNLRAGSRALSNGAPAQAAEFFAVGRELLVATDWIDDRATCFGLYLDGSEAALRASAFTSALELLRELECRRPTRMEYAQIAVKRIQVFVLTRTPEEAADHVLEVLRKLGLHWPQRPSRLRVVVALWRIRRALRRKRNGPLFRPADPGGVDWLPLMLVISAGGGVLSRVDAYVTVLASSLLLRLYLRDGYVVPPSFSMAALACWESLPRIGHAAWARDCAALALEWGERAPDAAFGPRMEHVIHSHVHPFLMRRRDALAPVDGIAERLREVGDFEYANYASFLNLYSRALAGDEIERTHERLTELCESLRRSGVRYQDPEICTRTFALLRAETLESAPIDERISECEEALKAGVGVGELYIRTLSVLVLCVYGRFSSATLHADSVFDRVFRSQPHICMVHLLLYRGIALAERAWSGSASALWRSAQQLRRSSKLLNRWVSSGPDFPHMICMLEAELHGLRGRLDQAGSLYTRAARLAAHQEFVHHVALAHERHGELLARHNQLTAAHTCFDQARDAYGAWGAMAKVHQLEQRVRSGR